MVTTNTTNYGLIRTVQVRNENIPGVLGALASAIGGAGANIGNIPTSALPRSTRGCTAGWRTSSARRRLRAASAT